MNRKPVISPPNNNVARCKVSVKPKIPLPPGAMKLIEQAQKPPDRSFEERRRTLLKEITVDPLDNSQAYLRMFTRFKLQAFLKQHGHIPA